MYVCACVPVCGSVGVIRLRRHFWYSVIFVGFVKEIKELDNFECAKSTRSLKKCDWGQPVCSVELSSAFCLR